MTCDFISVGMLISELHHQGEALRPGGKGLDEDIDDLKRFIGLILE